MILTDKNNSKIIIECDCGCEAIELNKFEDNDSFKEYFISILVSAFYSEQDGFFYKFKNRIKTAWYILRHGTHRLQEIVLTKDDFKDLQEIISKFE